MATKRDPPTTGDIVVTALSPVLIMGLVGSLVFFLASVFYAGRYEYRLLYTLFFYVGGAVLVGRVAVVVDRTRAWLYGGVLALVTFLALRIWVDYPPDSPMTPLKDVINVLLIGVVWWASNRLTWDCTFIDEKREGSGKGLLAAAGWEKRPGIRPDIVDDVEDDQRRYSAGMNGWYERYDQWRKSRDKRPHTPGLTVVYFSLAALPIFGLGQTLIPAEDEKRRAYTFWLAAIYVGSALGLLLTTSFLGLRRYLRQRKMIMPTSMTTTWLGLGAGLIVAFLVVGALLPRPFSETPPWNPTRAFSPERSASNYAANRDSGGKGEGRSGEQATKGDGKETAKGGEPGAKGKSGDAKQGSGDKQGKDGGGDDKSGKSGNQDDRSKNNAKGAESKESGREAQGDVKASDKSGSNAAEKLQTSSVGNALSKVANVLKWIVFVALAIIVLFVIFRHGLHFLSNFMPWAKNLLAAIDAWWKGVFGRRERQSREEVSEALEPEESRVPFAAFSNPFADGTAEGRTPEDLVRYSFDGLEAWAGDRDVPRKPNETPIEFSNRLGAEFDWLRRDADRLAMLVARMAYAEGNLPENSRASLEQFWVVLTTGREADADREFTASRST